MKIKAICRHEIVYKNGKSPLAIRFTHQRTHKTVSLGISVEPHYWDKTAEMITANCPERAALQSQIDSTLAGMLSYTKKKEAQVKRHIYAGEVQANPYELNGSTGCDYFAYRDICGFDPRLDGYAYLSKTS